MNLENKIAIVTGASGGTGRAFSKALIHKGATVYGLARRTEKLQSLRDELGEEFIPVVMDVTDHKGIRAWVSKTFTGHQPDILINNAGIATFSDVDELSVSDWHAMINTNVNGIFYLTGEVVPLLKKNPATCHIINISSVAGLLGNPGLSGYNATKFAVRGFSEALFKELRYDGIKVSCMFPGSIATDFFPNTTGGANHPNMMMPRDVASTLVHLLETPDNFLINEIAMRPLNPKSPDQ
ncbi:MAG: SDR family oxidoreductase [Balneolaceae bacterium]